MSKISHYDPLPSVLSKMIDNRGKSVPTVKNGFPLIATNCVKHSSIFPTFENIRYVDNDTLKNWFRAHLEPNDILFVNKGTPGRSCLVPNPVTFCAAQDMIGLRADESKIDFQYLFAILRSDYIKRRIENFHVGLVIPHFKKGDISNILIPRKEELKEESRIGKLYINLSNKIELNNRINSELEAMAKTLYDYWFVQFDFPDENGKPYKSSDGEMEYSEQLKREIPKGWDVDTLNKYLKTVLGGTPTTKNKDFWDGDIPWLNSGEVANFPITISEEKITEEAINNSATTLMDKNSIVLSITRHLRASILTIPCCANQSVVGVLESELLKTSYIYPLIVNEIPRYMSLRTGAQQPHINKGVVDDTMMILPNTDILQQYYKLVDSAYEKINKTALENQKLAELRDWLLPMLMNGQVSVA